jgi:hypothetical protein
LRGVIASSGIVHSSTFRDQSYVAITCSVILHVASDAMYALQPRPTVEISVEAQDGSNPVALHGRNVDSITSGEKSAILYYFTGSHNIGFFDWENIVDNIQNHLKRRPDRLSSIDACIPVQDLLQHFRIGNQPLSRCYQFF